MNIEDKAEEVPDIDLARQSAPGAYVMEDTELTQAGDLTPDGQFPEYGDFLPVRRARATEDGHEAAGEIRWIECPHGLAKWLVENALDAGDGFRVQTVQKVDGEWRYDCEKLG